MSRNYHTQTETLANTAVVESARVVFGQAVLATVNRASGRETTIRQRAIIAAALAPKITTAAVLTAGIGVSIIAGGVAEKASQAIDLFKSLGEE
jgi:hypothetical protein